MDIKENEINWIKKTTNNCNVARKVWTVSSVQHNFSTGQLSVLHQKQGQIKKGKGASVDKAMSDRVGLWHA